MKKRLLPACCFILSSQALSSQVSDNQLALLRKLDSIGNCYCISRYFATLYLETTAGALDFFAGDNEQAKQFMERLEMRFAGFFFRAVEAYHRGKEIPAEWKAYFGDTALSPLQYRLLGINAHINGDIWQALTAEFSLRELQENKEAYFQFNKGLIGEYRRFYDRSVRENPKTILLHELTLGLSKCYGRGMLGRWRKRQMQLAILFYTDRTRFDKELAKLHQKMKHLNELILNNL